LALAVMFVAGSAAQAFPFWHHRHHHHPRFGYSGSAALNGPSSNPGNIYKGH